MESNEIGKNKPEKKFRASPITATVWTNEGKNKEGDVRLYRTVSLERSYRDKEGAWQSTGSLRVNDLPKAVLVLNKAFEYVTLKETDDAIIEEV